jgi:hypothetical protein
MTVFAGIPEFERDLIRAQVHKIGTRRSKYRRINDVPRYPAASADPDTSLPVPRLLPILRFGESATPSYGRNLRATGAVSGQYRFGLFARAYLVF